MKQPKTSIRQVRADELMIHPFAQRRVVPSQLKRIYDRLDLDAIGVLAVVEYVINGIRALWVVDGQHRLAALLKHGFGEFVVTVQVHHDAKDDPAAHALFRKLNTRAAVQPYDRFLNEVGEGDPVALGVQACVKAAGLRVDRGAADGVVQCVEALKTIWKRDQGRTLSLTLETATTAWGKTASAMDGKVLAGLASVFGTFNGQVDRGAMVKKLTKYPGGPGGVLGSARAFRAVRSVPITKCIHEVVVEEYNKGRRSGMLGVD